MTHRSWSVIAAACALPVCLACSDDDRKKIAAAPSGPAISTVNQRDAGAKSDDDEDAGKMDAGSPITYCTRITGSAAGGIDSSEIGTWVETPGDLALTRQTELWSNNCSDLRLILEFSDGNCPLGDGHSVQFSFGYQDFVDGVVHGGNNVVGADSETPAISVRYHRPDKLTPHGTWGTCDGASGQLVFGTQPILEAGHYLQARYQLDLTTCVSGATQASEFVEGAFNVLLRTSRTDACPPTGGAGGIGGGVAGDGFGTGGDPFGAAGASGSGFDF